MIPTEHPIVPVLIFLKEYPILYLFIICLKQIEKWFLLRTMELNACQWDCLWKTMLLLCGGVLWFVFPELSVEYSSSISHQYALLLLFFLIDKFFNFSPPKVAIDIL